MDKKNLIEAFHSIDTEPKINNQFKIDYLVEHGYFCSPCGVWWSHTDFRKLSSCSLDWFTLEKAFEDELEYTGDGVDG